MAASDPTHRNLGPIRPRLSAPGEAAPSPGAPGASPGAFLRTTPRATPAPGMVVLRAAPAAREAILPEMAGRETARSGFHGFAGLEPARPPLPPAVLQTLGAWIQEVVVLGTGPGAGAALNLPGGPGSPGLPSGYTYLFQLAAHDVVSTAVRAPLLPEGSPVPGNLRRRPLALETLLGDGARACPFAYHVAGGEARLRLGQVRDRHEGQPVRCLPARDLPRLSYDPAGASAPQAGADIVLIPDARNDDNMLLGQTTALFHGIYNHAVGTLLAAGQNPFAAEEAARAVLVRLYRRILRHDLLARLLHPGVYRIYDRPDPPRLDSAAADGSVAMEFAFAAGRLAHALVREDYALNATESLPLVRLMQMSSSHRPRLLPLERRYLVDWDLFFPPLSGPVPPRFNWAFRFGPHVANGMKLPEAAVTPAGTPDATPLSGTTYRDLLREQSLGLLSVQEIVDHIVTVLPPGLAGQVFDPVVSAAARARLMAEGLDALESSVASTRVPRLTADERQAVVANPPLSLFLQIEARRLGSNGATLGPVGSVLVAEAFWPVFAPVPAGRAEDLALDALETLIFDGRHPTMPALIAALKTKGLQIFDS